MCTFKLAHAIAIYLGVSLCKPDLYVCLYSKWTVIDTTVPPSSQAGKYNIASYCLHKYKNLSCI